jgi:hypothetical protein
MTALIAIGVLAATAGIVFLMIRLSSESDREMRASADRLAPINELARAGLAGVFVAVPVVILVAFGAPVLLTTGYLIVVVAVAGWIVVRRLAGK